MNSIKNIIFDLGGVILNIDYNLTAKAFRRLGIENFDDIYSQARQSGVFDQYEVGAINEEKFMDHLVGLSGQEISTQQAVDAWNAMLLDFPSHRLEMLRRIGNTHRIFLLSNTNYTHKQSFEAILLRDVNEHSLNPFFEKIYYSHEIGLRKPDSEIFEFVMKDAGLKSEETLFIDDSIQHVESAKKLGIQTHHFTKKDIVDVIEEFI